MSQEQERGYEAIQFAREDRRIQTEQDWDELVQETEDNLAQVSYEMRNFRHEGGLRIEKALSYLDEATERLRDARDKLRGEFYVQHI
jgi:hypothetical protein